MKTYTLSQVDTINDSTEATNYNDNKTRILRIPYEPKLNNSKILIEISSYYKITDHSKGLFEFEISASEDKNNHRGNILAIRRLKLMHDSNLVGVAFTKGKIPSFLNYVKGVDIIEHGAFGDTTSTNTQTISVDTQNFPSYNFVDIITLLYNGNDG
jgi:hypothetical protein